MRSNECGGPCRAHESLSSCVLSWNLSACQVTVVVVDAHSCAGRDLLFFLWDREVWLDMYARGGWHRSGFGYQPTRMTRKVPQYGWSLQARVWEELDGRFG